MIHSRSTKYPNSGQKLPLWTAHTNLLENRQSEDNKKPYCFVPCGEPEKGMRKCKLISFKMHKKGILLTRKTIIPD